MSISTICAVMGSAARFPIGTTLVLMAMADCADESGHCFSMTIAVIAAKSRLSQRQVSRSIAKLKEERLITHLPGKGFSINIENLRPSRRRRLG